MENCGINIWNWLLQSHEYQGQILLCLRRANNFIKFPKAEAETRQTIQEFQNINRFPQVVGALDGLHIPIHPLHPNINMLILYTLLPTFPKVLTMRIYLKIRSSFIW